MKTGGYPYADRHHGNSDGGIHAYLGMAEIPEHVCKPLPDGVKHSYKDIIRSTHCNHRISLFFSAFLSL